MASSKKQPPKGKGPVKPEDETATTEPTTSAATVVDAPAERSYWLLKAEPETRLESGVDVKFSIDDLASRTEPEPWDGTLFLPPLHETRPSPALSYANDVGLFICG